MADITIYHNPNCSTSVFALAEAARLGVDVDVNEYLRTKPAAAELAIIVARLEDPPADLVRTDSFFDKQDLRIDDFQTPEAVVELLVRHPRLLQRPVLVSAGRAIIGRPRSRVEPFLLGADA